MRSRRRQARSHDSKRQDNGLYQFPGYGKRGAFRRHRPRGEAGRDPRHKEGDGENFIEYVTKVRIEKAKEFLAQPDISIKEAGIRSGYTDPNYFSRIFKKQTDMTPSEYKTRYGK